MIALIGGLLGCGAKERLPEKQVVRQAPTNTSEAGLLVTGAAYADILQLTKSNPDIHVRPLHENRGIYEIHGIDLKKLRAALPSSVNVNFNRYFKLPPTQPQKVWRRVGLEPKNTDKFEEFIDACSEFKSETPNFVIESDLKPDRYRVSHYMNLGATAKFKVTSTSENEWEFIIVISTPDTSLLNIEPVLGSGIQFSPDQVGVFKVFVVGKQKSDRACYNKSEQLYVTDNPSYKKELALNEKERRQINFDQFWQLNELGIKKPELDLGSHTTIAILDTGINYNHPYIAGQIARNEKEIAGNGVDDDQNGFIDDVIGYDFANLDSMPYDDDGHGTHVGGLAGSVIGVAAGAKILPIKAFNSLGVDMGSVIAAIYYAVDNGADIINASFGWSEDFAEFKKAIEYANQKGVVVVAASGNGDEMDMALNNDESPSYPANYNFPNVLTVTALDENGFLPHYANFGKNTVHLATVGGSSRIPLFSLASQNASAKLFTSRYGTSMAAALASGSLAVTLSKYKNLSAIEAKNTLITMGRPNAELIDLTVSGRAIDLSGILSGQNQDLRLAQDAF